MATTSSRLLDLLSLLGSRALWSGPELAARLDVSARTLRRDVESLRHLGYPVDTIKGPTAATVSVPAASCPRCSSTMPRPSPSRSPCRPRRPASRGSNDAVERALTSIKQQMPARLRAQADAMHLTAVRNGWEFASPPITADTLRSVGYAVRNAHLLRFDYLDADGRRPAPRDADFIPPLLVEPHHLLTWAGRWYLLAYTQSEDAWRIYRVDRMYLHTPTGTPFERRQPPDPDVARYVMTSWDRGDTPARWQCSGTALLNLPPALVARWAPGGSVVEYVGPTQTQITIGAWSWAGIAGLLATFDADITIVEPEALQDACRNLARRYHQAAR